MRIQNSHSIKKLDDKYKRYTFMRYAPMDQLFDNTEKEFIVSRHVILRSQNK